MENYSFKGWRLRKEIFMETIVYKEKSDVENLVASLIQ